MSQLRTNGIRIWQWPNVLSLDAALIAVFWQSLFAVTIDHPSSLNAAIVLALSVWLTYQADRLFDVSKRPIDQLLSTRHQFAHKHASRLWIIWWGILGINIGIAFTTLSKQQLSKGFILLAICLLYTLLNQKLSKRFFPKQLCVAIIYTGGVIIFLPIGQLWLQSISFISLCLMNCRLISRKEVAIDRALGERSQISFGQLPNLALLTVIACISLLRPDTVTISILATATVYLPLSLNQQRFSVEAYRVLIDGALVLAPTCQIPLRILNGL